MPREGFHPEYHDESFHQGVPPEWDEPGSGKPPRRPFRLAAARRFLGEHGIVIPALMALLVVTVGYALLPGASTVPPGQRPGHARPQAAGPGPAPVPVTGSNPAPPPTGTAPAPAAPASITPRVPARPAPAPAVPVLGAMVATVSPAHAGEHVFDLALRGMGIPVREVSATSPAWPVPRSFSLAFATVDSEGRVLPALPASTALALLWALTLGACAAGLVLGAVADFAADDDGESHVSGTTGLARLVAGSIALSVSLAGFAAVPWALAAVPCAGFAVSLAATGRTRLRVAMAALAAASAGSALAVPVVSPYPALAAEYGSLGVHAGDFAACCLAAAVAAVGAAALRRRA